MIRVLDIEKSKQFYNDVFDFKESHQLDFPDFKLVYLRNKYNESEIELTVNKSRDQAYTHGDGYGHIAFCVDNLDFMHKKVTDLKYQPNDIVEFVHNDELIARFFFVTDPDGYSIEVLQRHGHYQ